jgi:uncharacterized protein
MNEYPPPLSPAPPPAHLTVTSEDRTLAMLCHVLGIFTGFIGPLIVWLVKKDDNAYVAHHGRESLNFQLTLLLVMIGLASATFALMFVLVGIALIPLFFVVPILALIAEIVAAVAAQNGEWHRYPCCIRMV